MLRSEMFDNTRAHGIPLVLIFPSASRAQERGAFHWGPVEHQGHVGADGHQPSGETAGATEGLQMLISLQKGLLQDVLRVLLVPNDLEDSLAEHSAIAKTQFTESLPVSRSCFRKQLLVRWLRMLHSEMFENTCVHCIP